MDPDAVDWIRDLPEDDLKRHFGTPTFFRGKNYQETGRVVALDYDGPSLHALVRGSGNQVYEVEARLSSSGSLQSWCSCPVGWACKHVVASILAGHRELHTFAQSAPSWEHELAQLTATAAPSDRGKALALEFSVAMAGGRPTAIRLRPLREGVKSPWVRQDAAWLDLVQSWRSTDLNPAHRALLTQLYRLGSAGQYAYGTSAGIDLAELGPLAWPLLHRVADGGVEFVPGEGLRSVSLGDGSARVALDLTRSDDGGLRARARADVVETGPGATTFLVGSPAHGLAHLRAGDLTLWGLSSPPADGLDRLMAEDRTIEIPPDDVNRFLTLYHPALARAGGVTSSDGSVAPPDLSPPRLHLRLEHLPGHASELTWGFEYPSPISGGEPSIVPLRAEPGGPPRETRVEARLLAAVLPALERHRELTRSGRIPLASPGELRGITIADFLTETLPTLRELGVVVEEVGEPAEYSEADEAPVIHVSSEDGDEHDWFNLHVTVTVDGQDVPFDQLFSALAAGDEALLLDSGTWFTLDLPELHELRRLIEEARELTDDAGAGALRISPFQAALWEDLVELGVVARQSQRWRESVTGLLPSADRLEVQPPAGLRASLRHYQLEGYRWLASLWDAGLGGVLADDMGLGKTLQTLALLERAREAGQLEGTPALVVAPASVVGTWVDEAARFAPGLKVAAITSTSRKQGKELAARIEGAHVVVTSYTLLRLEDAEYRDLRWSALVLDEAQFVKNHRSRTYQAARRLGAPFTLAITGTPLENSLMDLWAMLSLAAPGLFPRPDHFIERYRKPIEMERDREALERLRRRIRPFVLRRTKREVVRELPDKIEQVQRVDLTPAHRKVYDKQLQRERQRVLGMLDDLDSNRIAIFRALTMLRQLALDPVLVDEKHRTSTPSAKVAALVEQVVELAAEGHRALVFSSFTGYLKLVREALAAAGVGHVYLDGRTRDRPSRIRQFREGEDPVFLISLKAGGFGLTLTEADYVFVLDPWWNPAAENQAIDRTHRIGQTRSVNVYKMVSVDTIEEKVVALQERKRDLFTSVVDSGTFSSGAISADDIRGLFED